VINKVLKLLIAVMALAAMTCFATKSIPLTDLEPVSISVGWGSLGIDRSVQGQPLRIGDRGFARGLGTHANSELVFDLDGRYETFACWVGVDAEMEQFGKSAEIFKVLVDGVEAFNSGVMSNTTPARQIAVSLHGARELRLVVLAAGIGIDGDHADWTEPILTSADAPPEIKPVKYEVHSRALTVRLSADGEIVGVTMGDQKLERAVHGLTTLAGFQTQGDVTARKLAGGGVEFERALVSAKLGKRCQLVDRFQPTKYSVRWEIEIRGDGAPWSAAISTRLQYPDVPGRLFWTAWSDPDHRSDAWHDPLVFRPMTFASWTYGSMSNSCPVEGDFITMPLATVAEPSADEALSLVLSPEDTLRDISLVTTVRGSIAFHRTHHRIGGGRPVRFAMDLVAHPADWRAALGWTVARYPQFFNPVNPHADEMAGCGAYSGSENPVDVARLKRMAFRINWKLSDDFAYMGMFLPPLKNADDHWDRSADEPTPPGKPRWTSFRRLNDYAHYMRTNGFYVLDYFNVTEYGKNMKDVPVTADAANPDLWKDPVAFLKLRLPNAYFQPPINTFYGAWVVDVGDLDYQRFILEQARRHIEKIPDSSGICIDRLDWLRYNNPHADDGVTWVDGRPARSLYQSWQDLLAKLGPLMHHAGKVIFVNNHIKRLELLREVDGIYCEFCQTGPALNATGLLSVRRSALGWTDDAATVNTDPDAFFQRHLYLGVFPTAPYPNNNHCLNPSCLVDYNYRAYGPLLDAMRGKKWVLEPHCVTVDGDAAKANLFAVPGGYVLPVTFGGTTTNARVRLKNIAGLSGREKCEAMYPGSDEWKALTSAKKNGVLVLDLPLTHGCAMVRIRKN